jgi:dihydrofolate synthase/folylpolyglutamate synthase
MASRIDQWHVAGLAGPRGLTGAELAAILAAQGLAAEVHGNVPEALRAACAKAGPADIICCFGSFYTVAEALHALDHGQASCNDS